MGQAVQPAPAGNEVHYERRRTRTVLTRGVIRLKFLSVYPFDTSNSGGLPGLLPVNFVASYWMLPRALKAGER